MSEIVSFDDHLSFGHRCDGEKNPTQFGKVTHVYVRPWKEGYSEEKSIDVSELKEYEKNGWKKIPITENSNRKVSVFWDASPEIIKKVKDDAVFIQEGVRSIRIETPTNE